MIWLESLIILACIMIGARKNGVAMGFFCLFCGIVRNCGAGYALIDSSFCLGSPSRRSSSASASRRFCLPSS